MPGTKKGKAKKDRKDTKRHKKEKDDKDFDEEMRTAAEDAEAMNNKNPLQRRVLPEALRKDPDEEDAQEETKGGKGKGKAGKQGGKLKLNQFTKDQAAVILMVVKLCLQTTQGFRDVQGILFDTFFIPTIHLAAVAMQDQGKIYSEAVQQKGHGLSDPHLYIFGSLLDYLANLEAADNPIKLALKTYEEWSTTIRAEHIKMCRLVKLFKEENRKLIIVFGHGPEALELRKLILSTMSADDQLQYIQGRPPPGHMERMLSKWASDMVS